MKVSNFSRGGCRNKKKLILIEEAEKCGDNEHYEECGFNCRPSCAKIYNEVKMNCSSDCVKGCFCNEGYLYDEGPKKCVKPSDCKTGKDRLL